MAKVDEGTVIQFNLKWFIGIIVTVISFFVTFYFTVQKPNNESIKELVQQRFEDQQKYQDLKFEKLDEMSTKIGDLQLKVDALSRRNDDLNRLRNSIDNTGATLGN